MAVSTPQQNFEIKPPGYYTYQLTSYYNFIISHLAPEDEKLFATATGFFIQPRKLKGPFGIGVIAKNHTKNFQLELLLHGNELAITEAVISTTLHRVLTDLCENPMSSPPPDITEGIKTQYVIYNGVSWPTIPDTYVLSTLASVIVHDEFAEKSHPFSQDVLNMLSILKTPFED